MKKIKFLWTLMALPLLAACSHDDLVNTGSENGHIPEGEGVYMSVNIVPFNRNTRSYTDGDNSSNGGTEVGSTDENKIKSVLIVLADENNNFIASAKVDGKNNSNLTPPATDPNNNIAYQAKAKFAKTTIANYYKKVGENNDANLPIRVFIYCNPTDELLTNFGGSTDNWYNWTVKDPSKLWDSQKGFLMTNVSIANRYLPAALDTWNMFSTEGNPFNLSGLNNANTNLEVDNATTGGSINVHRMAARFDFRDGSQGIGEADPSGNGIKDEPFTYKVMVNNAGGVRVKAKLINMSLVNLLKDEYYLERVSTDQQTSNWSTNYNLLGAEQPWFSNATGTPIANSGNYVVTPNASNRGYDLKSGFSEYYNYPLFKDNGELPDRGIDGNGENQWFTESVGNVCSERKDESGNYYVWRYVTENTLGEGENEDESGQVNGSSTGIVFKAQLLAGDALKGEGADYWDNLLSQTLSNVDSDGPVLFAFSNNLYCSWKHVQYAAIVEAGYDGTVASLDNLDRATTFYKSVFGDGGFGTLTFPTNTDPVTLEDPDNTLGEDITSANYLHNQMGNHDGGVTDNNIYSTTQWKNFRDKVVSNKFTIYRKYGETTGSGDTAVTKWGYFCYYYYWNRHNDNGQNGVMAPMEFAVVRNNVYKLAVISLKTLGHPRLPDNDPDSPTPDTPDEKSDVYMEVSVQVLPWLVRVNDIEF